MVLIMLVSIFQWLLDTSFIRLSMSWGLAVPLVVGYVVCRLSAKMLESKKDSQDASIVTLIDKVGLYMLSFGIGRIIASIADYYSEFEVSWFGYVVNWVFWIAIVMQLFKLYFYLRKVFKIRLRRKGIETLANEVLKKEALKGEARQHKASDTMRDFLNYLREADKADITLG